MMSGDGGVVKIQSIKHAYHANSLQSMEVSKPQDSKRLLPKVGRGLIRGIVTSSCDDHYPLMISTGSHDFCSCSYAL